MKVYRINNIVEGYALSKVTIHRLMKNGLFPKPIQFAERSAVGWRSSDIDHWVSTVSSETEARYE
ncbi:helix-turn-helix transcriptional regulator [Aeromonas caviae]|uniref:helix-turn-helix transcriptional regulator n=1 Tax=Aeromonas caviae TaxID=648 RepID=UPI003872FC49